MKVIGINGSTYKIECVYATKRSFSKNIGVHMQLQVFKNGKQLDKNQIGQYEMEKIEEFIKSLI